MEEKEREREGGMEAGENSEGQKEGRKESRGGREEEEGCLPCCTGPIRG